MRSYHVPENTACWCVEISEPHYTNEALLKQWPGSNNVIVRPLVTDFPVTYDDSELLIDNYDYPQAYVSLIQDRIRTYGAHRASWQAFILPANIELVFALIVRTSDIKITNPRRGQNE